MSHLLIADDDQPLCELLADFLQLDGFTADCVHHGDRVLKQLREKHYDLLVLDIMLPGTQGLDVLRELRRQNAQLPVIMLTARGDDTDRILGLELGADDYLPKPCNPRELSARIRAVLRRLGSATRSAQEIHIGSLHLDTGKRVIRCDGTPVTLTGTEFEILALLMTHHDEVITKEQLSESVLKRPLADYDRSIDMHISNLRRKLNECGRAQCIATIRGVGYKLDSITAGQSE